MWGNDNDISTTNIAHDAVMGIQSSSLAYIVIILGNNISYSFSKIASVSLVLS